MIVIILLILGLGRESLQLEYNTYSFKKATFWTDNSNNYYSTGLSVLTYNQDQGYMAQVGIMNRDPLEIYGKSSNGYSHLYTIQPSGGTAAKVNNVLLLGVDPQVLAVVSYSDNKVSVFSLNQSMARQIQTVTHSSYAGLIGRDKTGIIISQFTSVIVIGWNTILSQFDTVITAGSSGNYVSNGISDDGIYYLQGRFGSTTILELYLYSGGTYINTSSYDLSPVLLSEIKSISIYQDSLSAYYAVVAHITSGVFSYTILSLAGNTLTLHQQSTAINIAFNSMQMTFDGSYLLAFENPSTLHLYSYGNITGDFTEMFQSNSYPGRSSSNSLYISSNGQFISVGCSGPSRSSFESDLGFIHFTCTISNCKHCSFLAACDACSTDHQLINGTCSQAPPSSNTSSGFNSTGASTNTTDASYSSMDEVKIIVIVLVGIILVLIVAILTGFIVLYKTMHNIRGQLIPPREQLNPSSKEENDKKGKEEARGVNDTSFKMINPTNELVMSDFNFEETIDDTMVLKNRRRRVNKADNTQEIRVESESNQEK